MEEYEKSERITPKWKIKAVQDAMANMIRREDVDAVSMSKTLRSNTILSNSGSFGVPAGAPPGMDDSGLV